MKKNGKRYQECEKLIDKSKVYPVAEAIELLEKIGFKNIKLYSDFSKYGTECERVIFVCQKG